MSQPCPGTTEKVALSVYGGFKTMPAVVSVMQRQLYLPLRSFAIVRFQGTYYGVAYGGPNREVVVGENVVWFRKNWIMREARRNEFRLPYEIAVFNEEDAWIPGVWRQMRRADPGFAVFRFDRKGDPKDITSCENSRIYITLLGLTVIDGFWTREDLPDLNAYFEESPGYERVFHDRTIRGINPFRSRVLLDNGAIRTRPFY